jgi:hypothetical protein
LIFLWLLSFYQEKESDKDLWRTKNEQLSFGGAKEPNEVSSPKANEQTKRS